MGLMTPDLKVSRLFRRSCAPPDYRAAWPLLERMALRSRDDPGAGQDMGSECHPPGRPRRIIPEDQASEAVIREALRSLSEKGGEVVLPPGRIPFRETLSLPSGVSLTGVSRKTSLCFQGVDIGLLVRGSEKAPARDIRVKNLSIHLHQSSKLGAAFFATRARDLVIARVEAKCLSGGGFVLSDGVRRVRMDRCKITDSEQMGFAMVRDVQDCVLTACIAERCEHGIFMTDLRLPGGLDPVDFRAQLAHTYRFLGDFSPFTPEDPSPYSIYLLNCTCSGNRKQGIYTDGAGRIRIIGCTIKNNECEGITFDNGSWLNEVRSCRISGNGRRGSQCNQELEHEDVLPMGFLEDGSSRAKLPGISLDNAGYCAVEDSLIEGNFGDGVKCVRSVYESTIARNRIAENNRGMNDLHHYFGVLLGAATRTNPLQSDFPSANNRVMENFILGPHYAGVYLGAGTRGNLIAENRITRPMTGGISDLSGCENQVRQNRWEGEEEVCPLNKGGHVCSI
jgi:parallel beta-helix repeat protein